MIERISILQLVWNHILNWIEFQSAELSGHLAEMVKKVADFAPWLKKENTVTSEKCWVIGSQSGAPSLWEQFKRQVKGRMRRVLVTGAFFDAKLEFLRQIQQDLDPRELVVGVDPTTVQIHGNSKSSGIFFTDCSSIGPLEKGEQQKGYLHAKAIVMETEEGETILAVGSANPSAPAWLTPNLTGNVEIMLVRRGDEAEVVARELGLFDIPSMPPMTDQNWESAHQNWQTQFNIEETRTSKTGVALALDHGFTFLVSGPDRPSVISCQVLGQDMETLISCEALWSDGQYFADISEEIIPLACFIQFEISGNSVTCLVQHQREIEENSRTGVQRRFQEALASLTTDSPDLESLIKCVDKIIFAKDSEINRTVAKIRAHHLDGEELKQQNDSGSPLSIDITETKKTKKKYRLRQSDDLAYLLDVLIYHLKLETQAELDSTLESKDSKGRSEEEQIGAEDEEEKSKDGLTDDELATGTLNFCHVKVHTLVGRIINQLNALREEKIRLEQAIVRLTAVLAVLRQLRNCDGKVSWIRFGQTSFPLKERYRLFKAIVRNLFDGPHSIHYPSAEEQDLMDADELARLKGLILWLAWDIGFHFKKKSLFWETPEEQKDRIRENALMIALSQLVKKEEVVVEEARQSIGSLCPSDMNWLNWILSTNNKLHDLVSNGGPFSDGTKGDQGDLALIPARPDLGVRMILWKDANNTALAYFAPDKDHITYLSRVLKIAPFNLVYT